MEKDIFSLIISIFSFSLSFFVVYITYFQSPNIQILVGNNLTIFNSYVDTQQGRLWGGVAFYLPITFYNWNQTGGSVYLVRFVFGREDTPTRNFDMIWSNFTKIKDSKWDNEDLAQPIAIPGKGSVSKLIRFDWSPLLTNEKIDLKEGQYKLMIFVWTKNKIKPDIIELRTLVIEKEQSDTFKDFVQNNINSAILVSIGEGGRPNNLLSIDNIKNLYFKK